MATKVDHNYPTVDALTVTDSETLEPVQYAIIRIYHADSYPTTSDSYTWVGGTITNERGRWADPIFLDDGLEWVVEITRELTYDTQTVNITT